MLPCFPFGVFFLLVVVVVAGGIYHQRAFARLLLGGVQIVWLGEDAPPGTGAELRKACAGGLNVVHGRDASRA